MNNLSENPLFHERLRMLIERVLLLCLVFLPLTAHGAWLNFRSNPQHTGRTAEIGPEKPFVKWRLDKVTIMNNHSPVVGPDGTVYTLRGIGYLNDAVYAVKPDGTVKWTYSKGDMNFGQPELSRSGTLYTLASIKPKTGSLKEGYLIGLDALSGDLKTERKLSDISADLWTPHIVIDSKDNVFVGAADILYAMNADGTKRWSYKFVTGEKGNNPEYSIGPTLSPDEKTLYYYKRFDGGVMALDSATGKVMWHDKSPYLTDISIPTAGPDGTIYIPDAKTEALYALKPDGTLKWKAVFEGLRLFNSNATIGIDGTVYIEAERSIPSVGNAGGKIFALSQVDGKVKWSYDVKAGTLASPMAIDGKGNIYYGTGDGHIVCFNSEGQLLWRFLVGVLPKKGGRVEEFQIHMSGPVISDGTLYIIVGSYAKGGALVAIGSR
ncbi:MAG TPA: hypothetical protein DD725_00820 [Deltaproteobacteria bacterium]|nr:hypothetical protein [Deltaproteobacteria bacterium]